MDPMAESRTGTRREAQSLSFYADVRAEQLRLIYRQLPFAVVGALMGAFVTFFLIRNTVDQSAAVVWMLSVVVSYGAVLLLYRSYMRSPDREQCRPMWGRRLSVIGWLSAAAWGSASYWLYNPYSATNMLVLSTSLIIGTAAILVTTVSYRPLFYSSAALLLPLLIVLLWDPDYLRATLAIGVLVFATVVMFQHHHGHQTLEQALTLRFENLALAEQLELKREQAVLANQAKSRFLAVASHDLRQPLHAQQLFLSLLQQQLHDKDGADFTLCSELCEKLSASIGSLTAVFSSLLDFSKFESGDVKFHVSEFSLHELLVELQSEYDLRANQKGLRFSTHALNAMVRTDRVLLSRALRNFLENALRYTSKGGVLLGTRRRGDGVWVEVWDTGKGFSESEVATIFEAFQQLNPEHGSDQGLGLGLAVVRQVSDLLQLPLRVRSVPGRGSMFALRLPLASTQHTRTVGRSGQLPGGRSAEGVSVLLLEDDATVSEAMQALLQSWGYEVRSAESEHEARLLISGLQQTRLLVLADYHLGDGCSGAAFVSWLREVRDYNIPVAFVTASDTTEFRELARELGCPVLRKPVNAAKLRSVLRTLETRLPAPESLAGIT